MSCAVPSEAEEFSSNPKSDLSSWAGFGDLLGFLGSSDGF